MGHVGQDCVKVRTVTEYQPPSKPKGTLVGYYSSFFITVMFPVTELLKAKVKFDWSADTDFKGGGVTAPG